MVNNLSIEGGTERAKDDRNLKHNRGSPNAAAESLEKLPFELQKNETIIRELKPQFVGFMIDRTFSSYVGVVVVVAFIMVVLAILRASLAGYLIELLLLPLLIILSILIIAVKPLIQYGKSWYWITNLRVIGKRGFIGYTINSIPLENVTDVVLARTTLDRIFGMSALIIVPMGSSSMAEGRTANERAQSPNFFPSLTQETARELQRVLLNLRDDLKKSDQIKSAVTTSRNAQPTAESERPFKPDNGAKRSRQQSGGSNSSKGRVLRI
jgi:uncharacterized membrane protein YdbT with pleckstrin-like domain